jgi:hypothetical protein
MASHAGSDGAHRALEAARKLAQQLESKLHTIACTDGIR